MGADLIHFMKNHFLLSINSKKNINFLTEIAC